MIGYRSCLYCDEHVREGTGVCIDEDVAHADGEPEHAGSGASGLGNGWRIGMNLESRRSLRFRRLRLKPTSDPADDPCGGNLTMTTTDVSDLVRQFDAERAARPTSRKTDVRSAHRGDLSARAASGVFRLAVGAALVAVVGSIGLVLVL